MKKVIKKKVFVVEDDKLISRAFKLGLEKAGFLVSLALDGEDGVEKIKKEIPDIVILDLVMPIKNGFEVLKELKANKETKNIPVIVLSNLESCFDIQKAKDMGAEKYLLKTDFTIDDVIILINDYLK